MKDSAARKLKATIKQTNHIEHEENHTTSKTRNHIKTTTSERKSNGSKFNINDDSWLRKEQSKPHNYKQHDKITIPLWSEKPRLILPSRSPGETDKEFYTKTRTREEQVPLLPLKGRGEKRETQLLICFHCILSKHQGEHKAVTTITSLMIKSKQHPPPPAFSAWTATNFGTFRTYHNCRSHMV